MFSAQTKAHPTPNIHYITSVFCSKSKPKNGQMDRQHHFYEMDIGGVICFTTVSSYHIRYLQCQQRPTHSYTHTHIHTKYSTVNREEKCHIFVSQNRTNIAISAKNICFIHQRDQINIRRGKLLKYP